MKLALFALCQLATLQALHQKVGESREANVIPPGILTLPLNSDGQPYSLTSNISVSNNAQYSNFQFASRDPDVITGAPYYNPSTSQSLVSVGFGAVVTYDNFFNSISYTSVIGREWFNFTNVAQIQGQAFADAQFPLLPIIQPTLGFVFNKTSLLNSGGFIDLLFQQAYINSRIISFAVNFTSGAPQPQGYGAAYIGGLNTANFTNYPTNYSVSVDNGDWAFLLSNVLVGSASLGYNGYVTWDTISVYSVVPNATLLVLIDLLNLQDYAFVTEGQLTVVPFICSSNNYAAFPNITYSLKGKPLVFTPYQYVLNFEDSDTCQLNFASSATVSPANRAFTIGTGMMNSTYTVFDFDQKTVGVAPLKPN